MIGNHKGELTIIELRLGKQMFQVKIGSFYQMVTKLMPKLLGTLNSKSKCGNNERIKSWGMFLDSQHFGVEGRVGASR